ncbi:type II 3-dehydroquinate dehydratase [Thermophilibacter mediterraneus]|uniref:type II 3-dehydroquinate dehydratase n=1 Tax=Thermophilibacter mediterraneus TaxID=1871031 RepID=UPI00093109B6|nr:type II 3-dehydroquinate dehydratase [Thermophilibacter mediterraneus]
MDRDQIAEEVLAAVGGRDNVTANDICMTRLRILTQDPALVDTDQLSAARGVLGFVKRGSNGIEVVFGPGKVEAVHEALVRLTGIEGADDAFDDLGSGANAPIHVHITQNALRDAALAQSRTDEAPAHAGDSVDELVSLLDVIADSDDGGDPVAPLDEDDETAVAPAAADGGGAAGGAAPARVLVINGPNINMLGIREPDIYGTDTYQAMLRVCHDAAREAGFSDCTCFQSNHEGDLIDAIQDAYGSYAGIIINPGAYTHTSIAILDAAKAVGLPMIEVHISNVAEREEFRQVSYIRAACFETIIGLGVEGYRKAMHDMAAHLGL